MISGSVSKVGSGWWVRLECHGSKIGSDGGPLLFRELNETPGLHDIVDFPLGDTRTVHNRLHSVAGLLRQPVFGRSAGYDDVNDADLPALDPVMRQVAGRRGVDAEAASAGRLARQVRYSLSAKGSAQLLDIHVAAIKKRHDAARARFKAFIFPRERADDRALIEHRLNVAAEIFSMCQSLLESQIMEREHI